LRFLSSDRQPIGVIPVTSWTIDPRHYINCNRYARLAYTHRNAFFFSPPGALDVSGKTLVYDDPNCEALQRRWQKVIRVSYDFSRRRGTVGDYMVMPFAMHPVQYARGLDATSDTLRGTWRKIRLFFGGNMDPKIYSRSPSMLSISRRFGILSRMDILATVRTALGTKLREIGGDRDVALIRQAEKAFECVITRQGARVSDQAWLRTLSLCDVALCPPGAGMPYCHNLIEAMSVGTIPLTNYPEWFDPPLVHGKNCIAFREHDDLIAKIRMALELTSAEVEAMRRNVNTYYDSYLAPEAFLHRLRHHPARDLTLFVITEDERVLERVDADSVIFSSIPATTPATP
jgi:hypothetical protein